MNLMNRPPIAWTIAGSDSGGGAGIQADLKTFHDLDVHGCSVITALTAQNSTAVGRIQSTEHKTLVAQINALDADLPAGAIKLGMLGDADVVDCVAKYLEDYKGPVVCDPVLNATSGDPLGDEAVTEKIRTLLLSRATLITPNRDEAAALLGREIAGASDIEAAGSELLAMGANGVLITGGHFDPQNGRQLDYFCSHDNAFWLSGEAIATPHSHGSGCTLSSAIAANLAKGYELADALVLAKTYITAGFRIAQQIGGGPGPVGHVRDFKAIENLPTLHRGTPKAPPEFAPCEPLGLYPVVDTVEWIERLLPLGIKTIQLRIKDKEEAEIRDAIARAVTISREHNAQLFINDYWELAIELGAFGVHLGQEDLGAADIEAIARSGLRLGVSTHSWDEIARAHAVRPSYIAIGPIYDTTTKVMRFGPQGLEQLEQWAGLLKERYPLTAIGGINLERAPAVLATGVESCAMVTAITLAEDVENTVKQLIEVHRAC